MSRGNAVLGSRFMRWCILILGGAILMSFVDDELFLNQTNSSAQLVKNEKDEYRAFHNRSSGVAGDSAASSAPEEQVVDQESKKEDERPEQSEESPRNATTTGSTGTGTSASKKPSALLKSISKSIANASSTLFSSNKPKDPYTIVVEVANSNNDNEGLFSAQDLSRIAFAKMLQLEIQSEIKKRTIIKLYSHQPFIATKQTCFPALQELEWIDDAHLVSAKLHQQEDWLGESQSILLEPTRDVWQDMLGVLKDASSKTLPSEIQSTTANITLPFLHIGTSQKPPKLQQWQNLDDILPLLEFNYTECCLDQTKSPLATETVMYLSDEADVQPKALAAAVKKPAQKFDRLVVVGDTPGANAKYYPPLQENGWVVASMHRGSSLSFQRHCYLLNTQRTFVGLISDDLSVWTALSPALNSSTRIRMLGTSNRTFRERISIEKIPIIEEGDDETAIKWKLPWLRSNNTSDANYDPPHVDAAPEPPKIPEVEEPGSEPVDAGTPETVLPNGIKIPVKWNPTGPWRKGKLGTKTNPISIVVQLSGEMGNQLSKMAMGWGLQWLLEEDFNVASRILLRHQDHRKWLTGRAGVHQCFPNTREMDFEAANNDHHNYQGAKRKEWLGEEKSQLFVIYGFGGSASEEGLKTKLDQAVHIMKNEEPPEVLLNTSISNPFFSVDEFANVGYINERYNDRLKELFFFDLDDPNCCKEKAKPEEHVFHLRNFGTEMPKVFKSYGFEELSPQKMSNEAYAHLVPGDQITFTTRGRHSSVQAYIDIFEARNVSVRIVSDQNGGQDFCFLMSAEKELMIYTMSTYGLWAGYLGNATKLRMYNMESPNRVARHGDGHDVRYNFTNPGLTRVVFEEYKSEEQDEIDVKENEALAKEG